MSKRPKLAFIRVGSVMTASKPMNGARFKMGTSKETILIPIMTSPNETIRSADSNRDNRLEPVNISCADGTTLRGHFIQCSQTNTGKLPVLIAPATGVKQTFYFRFAQWLSDQGHDVLVFDYRGIGMSLNGPLAACKASLADWGQLDLVAALDNLLHRSGAAQAVIIGHSAGGQMIGLLPNHHRVARLVGISTSTGWFKGMRAGFAWKARLGLRVLVPLGIKLTGYAPTARLGLGENLPARVALQWGQWCAAGGYATHAVRHAPERDFHAQVRTPMDVLYASDDDIATAATVADLIRTLPAAPSRVVCVTPSEFDLKSLGHLDWFRQSHKAVWPLMASAVRGETINLPLSRTPSTL